MRFGTNVVRFSMSSIPVVGNVDTGAVIGLTDEGARLCDAMMAGDVTNDEIPSSCTALVEHLRLHGYFSCPQGTSESPISSAYLHISESCNLSCIGCYSQGPRRNCGDDPSLQELCNALSALACMGVVKLVISGGEPFLRHDLPEISAYARSVGISSVSILTNGTACGAEMLEQLADSVDMIAFSFDGTSSKSPAYVRRLQLFDKLVDSIRKAQSVGIHAHILPTLHAKNIEDVPKYVDLAGQMGCTVGFSLLSGVKSQLGDLHPDACDLTLLADLVSEIGENAGGSLIESEFAAVRALSTRVACGAARSFLSVAADGRVYPCHMLHYDAFCLGNVFYDEPRIILEHVDALHMPRVDAVAGCSTCDIRYLCGGGCRARSLMETGHIAQCDPYCSYYYRAIHQAVNSYVDQLA